MTVEIRWALLTAAHAGLLPVLSPLERRRIESLDRPADRARSLVAAALLRVAVAEHLGQSPAEVAVDRTCPECGRPHGAPRILGAGPTPPVPHVSVSHSGLLVVVALDPGSPVGVDVQRAADLEDPAGAAAWARSEALFKARATGYAADRVSVRHLEAPLDGYAAALAGAPDRLASLRASRWDGAAGR
ncbi:4'-phosphopantetheinyl transferase superfamily protein [Citricoccus sp. SGAir0253]|uniref:4'-phosphopantetheinyl transferase family protein n=1 Tax=Citricoccus sp. SGAir0253 TaxID=2567881 RepID=UPI001AEF5C5F|nr:hypothetical protein [Citricoccus sp. SGAir0253]